LIFPVTGSNAPPAEEDSSSSPSASASSPPSCPSSFKGGASVSTFAFSSTPFDAVLDSAEASPEGGGGAKIVSSEDCASGGICVGVVLGFGFGLTKRGRFHQYAKSYDKRKKLRVLSESRAMSLPFSRLIRQPRYEATTTEAPAAMANPCRERPTAELTGLEVCIPRRRDNRATPLSIFEVRDASEVKVKVNTVSQLRPGTGKCIT
jgi:hypothetical protein